MFKHQNKHHYVVRVRRNKNERWTEWAETKVLDTAKKHLLNITLLGWEGTIIDRRSNNEQREAD